MIGHCPICNEVYTPEKGRNEHAREHGVIPSKRAETRAQLLALIQASDDVHKLQIALAAVVKWVEERHT